MHHQRGVYSFILVLVLCLGLFTAIACAEDLINTTTNLTTPEPTVSETPAEIVITTPVIIETTTPLETVTQSLTVATREPTPDPTVVPETTESTEIVYTGNQPQSTDSDLVSQVYNDGTQIEARRIGPGLPPKMWVMNANAPALDILSISSLDPATVPVLKWSYGCSATSATMYYGYYDRNGYPNIYTGPTNDGLFPLTNTVWGPSSEGQGECPLSASHDGIDDRIIKGHVDDYYSSSGSTSDPYYGYWTEHSPLDSIGDFMGTSQYENWGNPDGATTFFFNPSGAPLFDFSGSESSSMRDGTHGMKLFAESRGYNVTTNYNQYIYGYNGNTQGFTYAQYKSEIDAGNPVLIHPAGHTVLGVGYSGTDTVIIHDTWDYSTHTMTWGGSYSSKSHIGVSVVHISPFANFTGTPLSGSTPMTTQFTDTSGGSVTSWSWDFGDGDSTNSTEQNPVHTFTSAGTYPVSLMVTSTWGDSNITTRTDYITVTVASAPTVTGITPLSGMNSSSVAITNLAGTNFYGTPVVQLNRTEPSGILATDVTVVDPARITCTFPITHLEAGQYNVTVINPDGQEAVLVNKFNVMSVSPTRIGIVRNGNLWLLDSTGDGRYTVGDLGYVFGKVGDVNVTGDWNGDGRTEIGVVRNGNTWLLDASGDGKFGAGDYTYTFGKTGDIYVTGDWNGDKRTEIGVVRNANGWLLDASGDGKYGAGDVVYSLGKAGDVYVTGDWNGDKRTEVGIVRDGYLWLLDSTGDGRYTVGDLGYMFGKAGDVYVTGDWNGDGRTEIGVVRDSNGWLLDASGNGKYGVGDLVYSLGKAGDAYVTGAWV